MRRLLVLILLSTTIALAQSVLVTASRKDGQPLNQLQPSDLKISGTDSITTVISLKDAPINFAFVLDSSNSTHTTWRDEREAASALIRRILRSDIDSGMLLTFSSATEMLLTSRNPEQLVKKISSILYGGGSATFDAVVVTAQKLELDAVPDQPRILFLIGDGDDNQSRTSRKDAITALQKAHVRFYALALESSSPKGINTLLELANASGGKVFRISTGRHKNATTAAEQIAAEILPELRNWWKLSFDMPASKDAKFSLASQNPSIILQSQPLFFIEK